MTIAYSCEMIEIILSYDVSETFSMGLGYIYEKYT